MPSLLRIKCRSCGKSKKDEEFYISKSKIGREKTCKDCTRERSQKWRDENQGYWDKWKYNLTKEEKDKMLESQGGTCANDACDYGLEDDHKLFVDHDHETGKVRGLLCNWCNTAEGYLKGDTKVAEGLIRYMRKHNGEEEEC